MLQILTVVGARPQFIKAAALSRAFSAHGSEISEQLIHTGQHFDAGMSEVFFQELDIPVPYKNLAIPGSSHGASTGRMLEALGAEFIAKKPDTVLVYGDTNSTLAGALAASKLHIPIIHVEAGMRSFNRSMPEEINRVLTDHLSTLLFCTSKSAQELLAAEGIRSGVHTVGDVMYDAVLHYAGKTPAEPVRQAPYALLTLHRAENADDPNRLKEIFESLGAIQTEILFPVHPRTAQRLEEFSIELPPNIEAVEPLPYLSLIHAVAHANYVITDSGGLQKEAYYLERKCICLREETEWTELLELDANRLAGASAEKIRAAVEWAAEPGNFDAQPYGDGNACGKIVDTLLAWSDDA